MSINQGQPPRTLKDMWEDFQNSIRTGSIGGARGQDLSQWIKQSRNGNGMFPVDPMQLSQPRPQVPDESMRYLFGKGVDPLLSLKNFLLPLWKGKK